MYVSHLLANFVNNLLEQIGKLLNYGDRLSGSERYPVQRGGGVVTRLAQPVPGSRARLLLGDPRLGRRLLLRAHAAI